MNPSIKVQVKYLTEPPDFSGFNDPAKGKTVAQGMYDAGADVVYAAAGGSGAGAFEAARRVKKLAIGVDSDQYLTAPAAVKSVILTSMLKRVDTAVYNFIKADAAGTPLTGTRFGLKDDGVGYATSNSAVQPYKAKTRRVQAEDHRRHDHGSDDAVTAPELLQRARSDAVAFGRARAALPRERPERPPSRPPSTRRLAITTPSDTGSTVRCRDRGDHRRARRGAARDHQTLPRGRRQPGHRHHGAPRAACTPSSARTGPASRP